MESEETPGRADNRCDDIAELARQYLMEPGLAGIQRIDAHIARAMAHSRWDEMSKWHRVRFRLIRLQQERAASERLGPTCESRRAG